MELRDEDWAALADLRRDGTQPDEGTLARLLDAGYVAGTVDGYRLTGIGVSALLRHRHGLAPEQGPEQGPEQDADSAEPAEPEAQTERDGGTPDQKPNHQS
jgi:hypothetical protein